MGRGQDIMVATCGGEGENKLVDSCMVLHNLCSALASPQSLRRGNFSPFLHAYYGRPHRIGGPHILSTAAAQAPTPTHKFTTALHFI